MNKKKIIIISLACASIIAVISITAFFLLNKFSTNEKSEEVIPWQASYVSYLSGILSNSNNYPNLEMQLICFDGDEIPILLTRYDYETSKFINMYQVDETGKQISESSTSGDCRLKILYNRETEKYEWFIYRDYDNQYVYMNLEKFIENSKAFLAGENPKYSTEMYEYTFSKKDEPTSTQRKKEFDKKYIDTNFDDSINNWLSLSSDEATNNLKELVKEEANKNKTLDTVLTEDVKSTVLSKVEADKKVEEEAKDKKEAEKKAIAEETAKYLKVGNHTLKYGKYFSDVSHIESGYSSTITLSPNGKFHIKSNYSEIDDNLYSGKTMDCDGTYIIELNQPTGYPDEYTDYITFKPSTGGSFSFEVIKNNAFSDQWHGYDYSEN